MTTGTPNNLFGLLCLAFVIGAIAYDCRRDIRQLVSARNMYLITLITWFLFEAVTVPNELSKFPQSIYDFGILCVCTSAVGFLVTYHSSGWKLFDGLFCRLAFIERPNLVWRTFLFGASLGLLPLLIIAKGNVLLILADAFIPHPRWQSIFQRGRLGGVRDAFLELQMFLQAAVPLATAIVVHTRQNQHRKFIAIGFLAFMFARSVNSGHRSQVLFVALPILAAIYWSLKGVWKKRALYFGLPAVVFVGFYWSAASVIGRNEGQLRLEDAFEAEYVGTEMFRELLFLCHAVPEQLDFQYGYTYYVQLVNPIPRFLWHGKPTGDAGLQLAMIRWGSTAQDVALTNSPGLVGEMYWNFGVLGVFVLSGVIGGVAKSWDRVRIIAAQSILTFTVYSAGLAIIFLSGRSFNMSSLYGLFALYATIILIAGNNPHNTARGNVLQSRSCPVFGSQSKRQR